MKINFLEIIQFSEKIDTNILGPNFFDPELTRPKLFQTERTWRLACLPCFCELVFFKKSAFIHTRKISSEMDVFTFSSLLPLIQSFDMLKVSEIQPTISKPLRKVFISGGVRIKSFKPGRLTQANM